MTRRWWLILEPPDLAEAFIRLAERYQRAVNGK
jgi:hypothetical protein